MSLWTELKRRNVVKVGIAYLALAWVVIQVTSFAVPAMNLPEIVNSVVFFFGLIFFPFVLLIAWAFEITPEGVVLTSKMNPEESILHVTGRRLDFIIIALMALAIVFLLVKEPGGLKTGVNDLSIAVLPFVNMSGDPENEFFSDGISEEILDGLAKVKGLRVIARTSSFYFKGKNESIASIGKNLKVATVLEGSVRKFGNRVRITAQLIRVSDQSHLWSETYDRQLEDVFAIQDEIAHAIVKALEVPFGVGDKQLLVEKNTENLPAYQAFMRGKSLAAWASPVSSLKAIGFFKQAIALDPDYAEAHGNVAVQYIQLSPYRPTSQILPLIIEAYQQALRIDPKQVDALAAKAMVSLLRDYRWSEVDAELSNLIEHYQSVNARVIYTTFVLHPTGRYAQIQAEMEPAVLSDPYQPGHLLNLAFLTRSVDSEGAIAAWEKALALDPYLFEGLTDYANHLIGLKRLDKAQELLIRMEKIVSAENSHHFLYSQGLFYRASGNQKMAQKALASLVQIVNERGCHFHIAALLFDMGDYDIGLDWLEKGLSDGSGWILFSRGLLEFPLSAKQHQRLQSILAQMNLDDTSMRRMGYLK